MNNVHTHLMVGAFASFVWIYYNQRLVKSSFDMWIYCMAAICFVVIPFFIGIFKERGVKVNG